MRSAEEILALYQGRKDRLAKAHSVLRQIRAAVLNEIDIPLPELDRNEKPLVANLILTGITQTANRIASTLPNPFYPPLKPGIGISEARARNRRDRTLDLYDKNNMVAIMRKRALHYLSYASSSVIVKPNPRYRGDDTEIPSVLWEVRDPLQTFPADLPIGQVVPDDAIFSSTRSKQWIENRYGTGVLSGLALANQNPDLQVTLLEYIDADQIGLYAIGDANEQREPVGPMYAYLGDPYTKRTGGKPIIPIYDAMPNRANRPLATVAGQISLERPQSMYEGVVGKLQQQAKLMALEVIGMSRSIWPEEWLVARQGETPQIVTQADPMAGVMGEVSGGDIKINAPVPAQFGVNLIDRGERGIRVEAGIPAEYGGESATNTRTDKRGNSILSATIDFGILAAHQAFETTMRAENRMAAEIERAYFPGSKTFMTGAGSVTYTPSDLWEPGAVNWMRYPAAGSDADGLVVAGGQRLGIGTMSKRSFMEIDPLVDNPELEVERVRSELLEQMLFQSLTGMAAQDPNYMTVIAELDAQLREISAPDIMAAWLALDKKYKADQAAAQQPEPGAPADQGAGQPGLAAPGAIGKPGADLTNLGRLAQVLRHTSRNPAPGQPMPPNQLVGAQGGP